MTNFILSEEAKPGDGYDRYEILEAALQEAGGVISEDDAMALLEAVCLPERPTLWSIVYNLETGAAQLAIRMKYSDLFYFSQ